MERSSRCERRSGSLATASIATSVTSSPSEGSDRCARNAGTGMEAAGTVMSASFSCRCAESSGNGRYVAQPASSADDSTHAMFLARIRRACRQPLSARLSSILIPPSCQGRLTDPVRALNLDVKQALHGAILARGAMSVKRMVDWPRWQRWAALGASACLYALACWLLIRGSTAGVVLGLLAFGISMPLLSYSSRAVINERNREIEIGRAHV